ncbi:Toxin coregulated pilus biosynthesis protein E [compost metagenome]
MIYTMKKHEQIWVKLTLGTDTRMSIYRKIAAFLEEGVPLHDILIKLSKQYKRAKDGRYKILNEWAQSLEAGQSFSATLQEWVPPSEAMIIRSGEKSGDLASAFANAVSATEAARSMRSAIIGNMAYPMALLVMICSLIYLFSTQAVPQLTAVKDPEYWPDVSRSLYDMSVFVQQKWWAVLIGVTAFSGLVSWSMSRFVGSVRTKLDVIPPWSVYRTFQSSVFMISISAMMKSGTPIVDSIKEMRGMSNKYVSEHLREILAQLNAGKPIGSALNTGFLDKETGIDIEIYGELADMQKSMERIGAKSIENALVNIVNAANMAKNLILIGVAGYIAWVYYALYTLTQSIGVDANMMT